MAKIIEQVGVFKTHSTVEDENLKEAIAEIGLISTVQLMTSYKNWRLEFGFDSKGQTVQIFADMSVDATNISIGHYGGLIAKGIYDRIK